MHTAAVVFQVVASLGLIASIVMQSGKSAGLSGSVAGGAEAMFGKKKGLDELLNKFTMVFAALFLLSALALSMLG
ncbi:preprotein translocase subunit SecG [Heliobacterium chlorum]|uniref:Protein-export membrane protein SecG n=1 Tax=Heliobacterium chlorum TaxID=2698 RepID=A0ABR7T0G8_HELCL|nr:preprotein translocase subunit SecG [Heliobacterium chlorum]MBC9784289.1 preprotein translocase subunit SecG [Heliobacterium chlorum]